MGSSAAVTLSFDDEVAVIRLDDGKANALSSATVEAVGAAVDDALARGARALVVAGREGRFSAGFDLAEMTAGEEARTALVGAGARLLLRIFGLEVPTVAACTGHALAAGALLLLSTDHRVGAAGPAKIGLNEVAIGLPLPHFAVQLATARLAPTALTQATVLARIYDPQEAVTAGFLDEVVDGDPVPAATAVAHRLAALPSGAHHRTKHLLRGEAVAAALDRLESDLAGLGAPAP